MNEQPIYEIPAVVIEGALEIQAGSSLGPDFPNAFDELDF